MHIADFTPPTSWTDHGMDWDAPTQWNASYLSALIAAITERLNAIGESPEQLSDYPRISPDKRPKYSDLIWIYSNIISLCGYFINYDILSSQQAYYHTHYTVEDICCYSISELCKAAGIDGYPPPDKFSHDNVSFLQNSYKLLNTLAYSKGPGPEYFSIHNTDDILHVNFRFHAVLLNFQNDYITGYRRSPANNIPYEIWMSYNNNDYSNTSGPSILYSGSINLSESDHVVFETQYTRRTGLFFHFSPIIFKIPFRFLI